MSDTHSPPDDRRMVCEVCGRSPAGGTTLYRQNPKGEPGIWACGEHNIAVVHPDVAAAIKGLRRGK